MSLVPLSTKLPPELAEPLLERATRADRTIAAELRRAVRFYLNNEAPAGTQGLRHNPGARNARDHEV